MAGDGEQEKCGRCDLAYNREERCPRTLVCGHTSCTTCLDALIQEGERRCPTCRRPFFSFSSVLISKNFEILKRLGGSSKSSSYSSPLKLKSSLSHDSSLARSSFSRGMLSASSVLGSSRSEDSVEAGSSMRPKSEGGAKGLYAASTGVSSPPPLPASAPPSIETYSDPQVQSGSTRSVRSQVEFTGASGVEGKGSFRESSGSGGSGLSSTTSSSVGQADGGINTSPTYAFPTIRTRLSTTGRADSDASSSSSSNISGKTELRPAKSLPPLSSSYNAFKSLPPLSSSLSTRVEAGSSSVSPVGYMSPFLKTSSSSSLNTNTLRSLQSGPKQLTTQDNTPSDSLSGEKDSSGVSPSSLTDSVDSSGLPRSMPSLHKLEAKMSVPLAGKKQDEVDLGVSKWKLETPTSLSRKRYVDVTPRNDPDIASMKTYGQDVASSHTGGQSDAPKQTDKQNVAAPSPTRSSGTPTHVLRMCRTITSKTRPAADDAAETTNRTSNSNTSSSSYQRTASFSSSSSSSFSSSSSSFSTSYSSSSAETSKGTHNHEWSSQAEQGGTEDTKDSQVMGMREAAPETPPPDTPPSGCASDGHSRSFNLHSSFGSRDDADDTSEGRPSRAGARGGMKVQCDEAGDTSRHSPTASSSSERRGEKPKATRKLALSASLSARLGARTKFLSTAIDEENEDDAGDGEASAGEGKIRTGRDGKLYKPDRQGVQPSRPHASLGARISARASYLSGGRSDGGSEPSRGGVQAEDSTKIDPQRRASRAWTKRGAAAGERHRASTGGEDGVAGTPSSYLENQNLGTPEGDDTGDAVKASPPNVTPPEILRCGEAGSTGGTETTRKRAHDSLLENEDEGTEARTEAGTDDTGLRSTAATIPSLAETKDPAVEGASRGVYSGYRRPRDVVGLDAAPAHELSQHSRWRHHRLIDSRSKEELSDPGCEPQAALAQGVVNTCRGESEAAAGRASGHRTLPDEGPSAPDSRGMSDPGTGSRGDDDRRTKRSEKGEGTSPVFRSEENANTVSDTVDGSSNAYGGILGRESGSPAPRPTSDLYPWRKKWRSVTERTSFDATRHTRAEAHGSPLSGASKEPEHLTPEPRSLASQVEGSRAAGTREDSSLSTQHSGAAAGAAGGGRGGRSVYSSYRGSLRTLSIGRVSSIQGADDEETETHTKRQGAAQADQAEDTPSGSIYTRDQSEGIQTAGDARNAEKSTDVGDTNVLKGSKRTEACLASSASNEGKHFTRIPDAAHQTRTVPRGAAEHTGRREEPTSGAVGEDTQEDLNTRLRRARLRLRATSTTPTEEDTPPAPARTNLTYLLTRLQSNEVKRTSPADKDEDEDEVFDENSEDEEDADTQLQTPSSNSSGRKKSMNGTGDSRSSTKSFPGKGHDHEKTTDEPDSVTRQLLPRSDQDTRPDGDTEMKAGRQEQDENQSTDEDCTDAPYDGPPDGVTEEYEPGVGLCSSHGLMLHLYCEDCGEWICDDCLRVLHRPRPQGSCRVISAAEGVKQMKVTHESFLASRTNTLEYFREELRRIVEECDNSITLHGDNVRRLEEKMEEEQRLLRGIESMRSLAKEKLRQVDYWEDVLQENLSRIDESSSSGDVLRAVRESSSDILQKAMKAVSLEAGAGVLLSPPN